MYLFIFRSQLTSIGDKCAPLTVAVGTAFTWHNFSNEFYRYNINTHVNI